MTTVTATDPVPLADDELAELTAEIRSYVENEGERWAERIEAERAVPDELWPELRDRGYLRIHEERVELPDLENLRELYGLLGVKDQLRGPARERGQS